MREDSVEALKDMLFKGASCLGTGLNDLQARMFLTYLDELKKWNKKINLTSIRSDKDIVARHFLDSLSAIRALRHAKSLVDIGSGAGFPGIPIKIALPEMNVMLLESIEKKVNFLRHIIRVLGLTGIKAELGRAEDPRTIQMHSETFDCAISRALSGLKEVFQLSSPYVRKGGLVIAVKGPCVEHELKDAGLEGIAATETHTVDIPFSNTKTYLVCIEKQ